MATANASMNADFNMDEVPGELHHGVAALALDRGDAGAGVIGQPRASDKPDKPPTATAAKEV